MLVLAAESIAQYAADDFKPHHRAKAVLHHLDVWARQHPQPSEAEALLWKALQGIPWCPVMIHPPDDNLPWPHARPVIAAAPTPADEAEGDAATAGAAAVEEAVMRVAPKLVAPAEMCWFASAPLRLLEAEVAPSLSLQQLMGWTQQQVSRAVDFCYIVLTFSLIFMGA